MNSIKELNEKMLTSARYNESIKDRKIITGGGNISSKLILIGEAPGGEEEKQGKPFVGKAGKNLDEFLTALNLKRADIYITNLVKVRPVKLSEKTGRPVNRPPDKNEIDFFKPFLTREIELIDPEWIITLGNFALKALLNDKSASIGALHGAITGYKNYKLYPLYHPASIIYNQSLKDVYQDDLLKLKKLILN